MPRQFNTAGPCVPDWHYTVDSLHRLAGVRPLIDGKHYFVLHAPRQTGKTTYMLALARQLNAERRYTALTASVQEAAMGRDPFDAMKIAARCIEQTASRLLPEAERPPAVDSLQPFPENGLRAYLQHCTERTARAGWRATIFAKWVVSCC